MKETVCKGMKILLNRIGRVDFRGIGLVAGAYLILEMAGITCPILFLTGVSCGGCGMSRAWLSLCRLDLTGALHYHPLFWLPVPAALLFLFKEDMPKRWFTMMSTVMILLFLTVYLMRLFMPQDDVVVFCPANGFFYRLLVRR